MHGERAREIITRSSLVASALRCPCPSRTLPSGPRELLSRQLPPSEAPETLSSLGRRSARISRRFSSFSAAAISPRRGGYASCPETRRVGAHRFLRPISCQIRSFGFVGDSGLTVRAFSGAGADQMEGASGSTSEVATSLEYVVGGRYCVLLTGHASDYSQKLYGGYGQMFIKLLGDPLETWKVYPVVDGQFPPEDELEQYEGFVVTGSRHDAHSGEEWVVKLCDLLQSLHQKKQKILGVCFGHQVLSRALGGKTGKADVGWEIGLRNIQTTDALATRPYGAGMPRVLRVLESHQDQVKEIPPGGELLGFSERTAIEMFAVGELALGIQGHPEFTDDVVMDIIDSRRAAGVLKEEESAAAKATLRTGQPDVEALVQLCKGFLKRRS